MSMCATMRSSVDGIHQAMRPSTTRITGVSRSTEPAAGATATSAANQATITATR